MSCRNDCDPVRGAQVRSVSKMQTIRLALVVFGMGICAAAQNSTAPAPAFGQNAPVLDPENPPVTGFDEPSLDLRMASRSFISPALQVSESADTNGGNQIGGSDLQSVTRVLGALDLQQFWLKSDLFLEYLGGGAFYGSPYSAKQVQAVGLEGVTRWRTGQVTVRDAFSYLPDGSFFIGTYGGAPGLGLASGTMGIGAQGGTLPGFVGGGQLGSIGNIPRLANTALLDVVQAVNPRSAITVAGGYSNAHFYDSAECAIPQSICLINSDQVTFEGGYTHLISRRDQLGAVYGFQRFQFPENTGGDIYSHIFNVRWSHTISGRLSLIAGVGPQYTDLEQGGPASHWSVSARVLLRYKLGRASLVAIYEKFTSAGSGFLAGANTQAARLGYRRPLGRTWEFYADLGYSNNKRLQPSAFGASNATSYNEGAARAVFRKHLGRSYDFFADYQFTAVSFNTEGDAPLPGNSGRISHRHTGMIGVEWHPRPTRIE